MAIIESEQTRIIPLTQVVRGPFYFRYASYPKREDAESGSGLHSEDYIVTDIEPYRGLFALCDGVGTSFYGNIGSQFLGETLLGWLRSLMSRPEFLQSENFGMDKLGALRQELKAEIDRSANAANSIVMSKDLSQQHREIRLAEEMQRNDFGTQSNFVCGLILPKSSGHPNGLLLLFWLGNARIRLFRRIGEKYEDLTSRSGWGQNPQQLKEVWSSKEGAVGQIYSYYTSLSEVTHVLAYSDGLESVEEKIQPGFGVIPFKELVDQAQLIKDDDVSFVEIMAIPEDLAVYADDIVSKIRAQPVPVGESLKVRELFNKLKEVQHKVVELTAVNASLRKKLTQVAVLCSIAFLISGIWVGVSVNSILSSVTSTATSSSTPLATITPVVPTATFISPTATITVTETATLTVVPIVETETGTISPTLELIASPTETVTVTETSSTFIATIAVSP